MKSLLVIIVLAAMAIAVCHADPVIKTINIRPGVDEEHFVENNGVKCKFSYSCTGGSSEEWQVELDNRDGEFLCTISRGSPSYLFFTNFKASFDGKPIASVDVLGVDRVLVIDRDYIIQLNEVKSVGTFEGTVNSLLLVHTDHKDEL
jgi:hypothetical protein